MLLSAEPDANPLRLLRPWPASDHVHVAKLGAESLVEPSHRVVHVRRGVGGGWVVFDLASEFVVEPSEHARGDVRAHDAPGDVHWDVRGPQTWTDFRCSTVALSRSGRCSNPSQRLHQIRLTGP